MWHFLRKRTLFFLAGFVVAFIVYLFVRWDPDKVLLGMLISAGVGAAVSWGIWVLERKFPERTGATDTT